MNNDIKGLLKKTDLNEQDQEYLLRLANQNYTPLYNILNNFENINYLSIQLRDLLKDLTQQKKSFFNFDQVGTSKDSTINDKYNDDNYFPKQRTLNHGLFESVYKTQESDNISEEKNLAKSIDINNDHTQRMQVSQNIKINLEQIQERYSVNVKDDKIDKTQVGQLNNQLLMKIQQKNNIEQENLDDDTQKLDVQFNNQQEYFSFQREQENESNKIQPIQQNKNQQNFRYNDYQPEESTSPMKKFYNQKLVYNNNNGAQMFEQIEKSQNQQPLNLQYLQKIKQDLKIDKLQFDIDQFINEFFCDRLIQQMGKNYFCLKFENYLIKKKIQIDQLEDWNIPKQIFPSIFDSIQKNKDFIEKNELYQFVQKVIQS